MMANQNIFFAHSGGVTATINATLSGVVSAYKRQANHFNRLYVGCHGILGALNEEMIDVSDWTLHDIKALAMTPGSAYGSCRFKLQDPEKQADEFARILDVFKAHQIGYFIYNGGNDSQDTTLKLSEYCKQHDYPLICVGVPKTIDNDLIGTDHTPGFGSAAKYLATSIYEAGIDLAAMHKTSTKVFILEVMGRHAGWLAAATALAPKPFGPDLILMPERPFDEQAFLTQLNQTIEEKGYCIVTASEGLLNSQGELWSANRQERDAFGHQQLGGVGSQLAHLVQENLKHKVHFAQADYLQRSARHLAAKVDVDEAYRVGSEAIRYCQHKKGGFMVGIERIANVPYRSRLKPVKLDIVANQEKQVPDHFIDASGMYVTPAAIEYLRPLIVGEAYPSYHNGLPIYRQFKATQLNKKLNDIASS